MSPLICIPGVAVFLVLTLWAVLRPRISFQHFPLPDYRAELEFAVFLLPGGLAGWLSMHIANSYLTGETNIFNLAWVLGLVVAFIIWEFIGILSMSQAFDLIKAIQDARASDFIAMGVGFIVGVLIGSYDIIIHQPQPPAIVFSLSNETVEIIFIILAAILFIALSAFIDPYIKKWRRKSKRSTSTARRKKKLDASAEMQATEIPPPAENQAHGDEDFPG